MRAIDGNGKALDWCYSCGSMEKALKKKDELLERYPEVTVRDNATRKVEVFRRDGKEKEGGMDGDGK